MRIGCPREKKAEEYRVALTPQGVRSLCGDGHQVVVEAGAGFGAGFSDESYLTAGARVVDTAAEVYGTDLVVKVKEPIAEEYGLLRHDTAVFCYLHLAANPELARVLIARRVTAIAFETITSSEGGLPLLAPMSMVAGRLSVQVGAESMQTDRWGRGLLLSGLPGVEPAHVVILGAGTVGRSALQIAVGMGARVTVLDVSTEALRAVDDQYDGRVQTMPALENHVAEAVRRADLVIGAVLVPGARAPVVVTREMIRSMTRGSVVVDVAVDQGGCFETTRPTTHHAPTYLEEGVIHYAVSNMPSLTARTSTLGLADVTLPVLRRLARDPLAAMRDDEHLANGLTTYNGAVVQPVVSESLGLPLGRIPF